ncbi:Protein of unknown function [Rhizobiales bacterium GAS113]|nr:Protein of unknown function [Rhizobiales bacterium GAS113]
MRIDKAWPRLRHLFTGGPHRGSQPRRIVYTCLFGHSEPFKDFEYDREGISDFICFTDDPDLRSTFWKVVFLPAPLLDSARASKRIKHQPHRFLPDAEQSLYLDNTIRLRGRPRDMFDLLEAAGSPLVCIRHPDRNCVYDEAREVVALGYDGPGRVERQMRHYRRVGYPAANGLAMVGMLLRRHGDARVMWLGEEWFEQLLLYSHRDQLSFNVVAWQHAFEPTYLDPKAALEEVIEWPVAKSGRRVPRDFDDDRYFRLNPDIPATDARRHYFQQGEAEGRRYK